MYLTEAIEIRNFLNELLLFLFNRVPSCPVYIYLFEREIKQQIYHLFKSRIAIIPFIYYINKETFEIQRKIGNRLVRGMF